MDYEKKYKEALGWMQSLYPTMTGADKEDAEHFFPELAESEDERIRKALIHFIKQSEIKGTIRTYLGITEKDMLAWLEKQSKDSPVLSNSSNIGKVEQKPVEWSEEDEKILKDIITDVKFEGYNNDMQADSYKKINWLKSIKDRYTWKPSDEQISVLEFVMEDIEKDSIRYAVLNSVLEQLKKLREE